MILSLHNNLKKIQTMKKLVILLLALAIIPATQSCKKKKEESLSAKEILTKEDWTLTYLKEYDAQGNLTQNSQLNFKFIFKTNNVFEVYDTSGNLISSGNWSLLNNDTQIEIDNDVYDIDKLEMNEFIISRPFSNGGKEVIYMER